MVKTNYSYTAYTTLNSSLKSTFAVFLQYFFKKYLYQYYILNSYLRFQYIYRIVLELQLSF